MLSKSELEKKIKEALGPLAKHVEAKYSRELLNKIPVDDIVQETFTRAVTSINSFEFRSEQSLLAWLKQIANNYVISVIRNFNSKTKQHISDLLIDSGLFTASSVARKKELKQAIDKALDQLEPENRELVRLRYAEGCSFVEISEVLELTDGAVRGRHRNSIQKLRNAIELTGILSSSQIVRTDRNSKR